MRRKTQLFQPLTNFFFFSSSLVSSELLEAEVEATHKTKGFYRLYIVHRTLIVVLFKLL